MRGYHRAAVPHSWTVDPEREMLSVFRYRADGYLVVMVAEAGELVRAEPFGDVELDVGALFGEEEG
jgi:hypothetical protein